MFLTLFFCAVFGLHPGCKTINQPLPPFKTVELCLAGGHEMARTWVLQHPGWELGGVRCSAAKPK
jgi:hypothetical protein